MDGHLLLCFIQKCWLFTAVYTNWIKLHYIWHLCEEFRSVFFFPESQREGIKRQKIGQECPLFICKPVKPCTVNQHTDFAKHFKTFMNRLSYSSFGWSPKTPRSVHGTGPFTNILDKTSWLGWTFIKILSTCLGLTKARGKILQDLTTVGTCDIWTAQLSGGIKNF